MTMSDFNEIFLNTPMCDQPADDRKTLQLKRASMSWWIQTSPNDDHGRKIMLLDTDTPDPETQREHLMRLARHHDVGRNQYVLMLHSTVMDSVDGRLCLGLEDALEELLEGECKAWLNEYGDMFVQNAKGHYELLWLSNNGRHWLECERNNPHYNGSRDEERYCFRMLAFVPGMSVIIGDLDGRLTELMVKKYGALDDEPE